VNPDDFFSEDEDEDADGWGPWLEVGGTRVPGLGLADADGRGLLLLLALVLLDVYPAGPVADLLPPDAVPALEEAEEGNRGGMELE